LDVDLAEGAENYFLALGLSQYGLLHFGQTRGFSSALRGTHSCPQRSQRKPDTVNLIFAIRRILPASKLFASNIPRTIDSDLLS
jgi:hypothetical protein